MGFSFGLPDGTYRGKPTTASCYEKDGAVILDIRFAVIDPNSGETYKKDNGYDFEVSKRHWITTKDGSFNEATINGIKEWAKGWNPQSFNDFYWFQSPDANGTPFGNLSAIGEVELAFKLDKMGNQQIWVHDLNRRAGGPRKPYVPEGGISDPGQLAAKWGAKAKALFSATPQRVNSVPTPAAVRVAPSAPVRPTAPVAPVAPKTPEVKPWNSYSQDANGAFAFFCDNLGEPYSSEKHDEKWFAIMDRVSHGRDPDELDNNDIQVLFESIFNEQLTF